MPLKRTIFAAAIFGLWAQQAWSEPARVPQAPAKKAVPAPDAAQLAKQRRTLLAPVKSWTIQLRYLDLAAIASAPVDMIVIDHARHPKQVQEVPFTRADLDPLKMLPGGKRRIVLAYLSMGEAERYRYYWKPEWDNAEVRPAWLGAENAQWPGNYLVDFAHPDWQSIIFGGPESYLDRIIAAGFDGVYLDRADAFEDGDGSSPQKIDAMTSYVKRLADHARHLNPNFLVVMQNAETLVRSKSLRASIDAVVKEDLWFGVDHTEAANDKELVQEALDDLRLAKNSGLKVFLLEYVTSADPIEKVRTLAKREGFFLHLSERYLDKLTLDEAGEPKPKPSTTQ